MNFLSITSGPYFEKHVIPSHVTTEKTKFIISETDKTALDLGLL